MEPAATSKPGAEKPSRREPMLLRLRSGKIAAAALVFGFGGGIMLLAVGTSISVASEHLPILGTLLGYACCALPFILLGVGVGLCRSELWLMPEERALRLLTYRPWLRGPRVEQASLDEYAGVLAERADDREGGGAMVSLVMQNGERVELRQFKEVAGAPSFAREVSELSGLWCRGELVAPEDSAPIAAAG